MNARRLLLCSIASAVLVATGCGSSSMSSDSSVGEVVRVVDGDTLILDVDGESERVRLLGIDTPELGRDGTRAECGAERASASLAQLAASGARARVVTDPETGDVRDQYDRLLAFVSVGGRDLGLAQLKRGWARVYAYDGRRFSGRVAYERAAEAAARQQRGFHQLCARRVR